MYRENANALLITAFCSSSVATWSILAPDSIWIATGVSSGDFALRPSWYHAKLAAKPATARATKTIGISSHHNHLRDFLVGNPKSPRFLGSFIPSNGAETGGTCGSSITVCAGPAGGGGTAEG